jgi:hypothetical protein
MYTRILYIYVCVARTCIIASSTSTHIYIYEASHVGSAWYMYEGCYRVCSTCTTCDTHFTAGLPRTKLFVAPDFEMISLRN